MVGGPYRDERRVAVSVASEDARQVDAAEGEQPQLPCRSADLDDAFQCGDRFVDVAGLFEDTAERVEVRFFCRGIAEAPRGGGSAAEVGASTGKALFGFCDVADEGVKVVEGQLVTEWAQEA